MSALDYAKQINDFFPKGKMLAKDKWPKGEHAIFQDEKASDQYEDFLIELGYDA